MLILLSKCLLLLFNFIFIAIFGSCMESVIFFLFTIISTCLLSVFPYHQHKVEFYCIITFNILLSIFIPDYASFLAILLFDCAFANNKKCCVLFLLPILNFVFMFITNNQFEISQKTTILNPDYNNYGLPVTFLILFIFCAVSYLLGYMTNLIINYQKEIIHLRDTYKENNILLQNENKNLLIKQDYEIHIATLNERNRIAREIHDNVGHMLSRSILQIGALIAINKNHNLDELYENLKNTLNQAMDSIRSSVHDLHEESIDLNQSIQTIIKDFHFCHVTYEYDMPEHVNKDIKYSFIAITKEALNNIIKHSNATEVTITILEHPAFYQLIIKDNGKNDNPKNTLNITQQKKQETSTILYSSNNQENLYPLLQKGIGLSNMKERIDALNGRIEFSRKNGFCIFISIPKN